MVDLSVATVVPLRFITVLAPVVSVPNFVDE